MVVMAGCATDPAIGNDCVGHWAADSSTLDIDPGGSFELTGFGELMRGTATGCTGARKELRLSLGTTLLVVSVYADGSRVGWADFQPVGDTAGLVGRWRAVELTRAQDSTGKYTETWAWGDLALAADHSATLGCDSEANALCTGTVPPSVGSWDASADTVMVNIADGEVLTSPILPDGTFAPLVFERRE